MDNITGNRVRELRLSNEMTQQNVADKLNMARGNYSRYENGLLEFNHDMLRTLAKLFDVSTDYLLGLKNDWN